MTDVARFMITEHQKQTAFLKQLISYEDTAQQRELYERINQVECNEVCVRRAICGVVLSGALAAAGLCYSLIFLSEYPFNMTRFMMLFLTKLFAVIGLGSMACAVGFLPLQLIYRRQLNQRREECRHLAMNFIESRFGRAVSQWGERHALGMTTAGAL